MTNVSSGIKRTWDGVENEPNKRSRSREEPKDWKDVHLKPPSNKGFTERRHTRDYDYDRRAAVDRRNDRRDRVTDYRHPTDHGRVRDRSRRRDDRERERERERYHARKDEYAHRNGHSRSKTRSISPKPATTLSTQANYDSEKEEGEISPTRSTPERQPRESRMERCSSSPKPEEKQQDMELDMALSPPPVEDLLAARRARRQAIIAKYAGTSDASGSSSAVQPPPTSSSYSDPLSSQKHDRSSTPAQPVAVEHTLVDEVSQRERTERRESMSASPTPRDFTLAEEGTEAKLQVGNEGGEQVSAADYDPSLDRREDEQKRFWNFNHVPETVEEVKEEEEE
ncbi:hypothetical protein M378DRAFT_120517, partial [Amanita muscaria Koide BX008]